MGSTLSWLPSRRTCDCPPGKLNCLSRLEMGLLGSTVLSVNRRHRWLEKHKARFIPDLPERYLKLFSHRGESVLDPFAGSGTTNVVAKSLGRNSVGVDVNPRSVEITRKRLAETPELDGVSTHHEILLGDSRKLLASIPRGAIDIIVTSPPYYDVVDYDHDSPDQLGNYHDYGAFMQGMAKVFDGCRRVLKPGGVMVVNTQDIYKKVLSGAIHVDYIERCRQLGFNLMNINIYILNYSTGGRLVWGYPKAYYPKNDHEFNLIFRAPEAVVPVARVASGPAASARAARSRVRPRTL
jgi:DNA modification methylase